MTFHEDASRVPVSVCADIVSARKIGAEFAARLGFSAMEIALIATIVSELARGILDSCETGQITFAALDNGARRGLEVVVRHGTPSLPFRVPSMTGELADVGKLMDEFSVIAEEKNGTTVRLKKWRVG